MDTMRADTAPWITVVGIGEDGLGGLGAQARACIDAATILIGGDRHLAMLPAGDTRPKHAWPSPLKALRPVIEAARGHDLVVLASGDPFCWGIGTTLARWFGADALTVHPAPSAASLVCARLGWSLPDVRLITLHGRPLALLDRHLQPGARLVIYTDDGAAPAAIARRLAERGFGASRMTVLACLGGPHETIRQTRAADWGDAITADLNTVAVTLAADAATDWHPTVPGLDDDAFDHDGQLTKREMRAITLARLMPAPRALLWDIGAGNGSIGIEWLRAEATARAVAVEPRRDRAARIRGNAEALGVPALTVIEGSAPAALDGLPAPDAIFLGGAVAQDGLIALLMDRLIPGGRLVANAVTLSGEAALADAHHHHGGDLIRVQAARAVPVGPHMGWRAAMPVTQYVWRKR
ncbi:precorrin-6y C5,15-methyltransferase (decarboxylating) subunit CbiE [Tistrella sp. BH-R2-4]|uniref:Precorrin-6y C5,15-methyltransferase (Decarboxylating) subunit CbiE n=1 Tax=Tistrella arctica TaxID=3133430 RepID=A0ABU9YMA4_9PROT